jgi:hypothetical protein
MIPMKAIRALVLMLLTATVATACNPSSITAPSSIEDGRHPVIGGSGG